MDSMNSFADLQALQQPSLGQALTMQPQQPQPQQPAQGPPATPEEYGQRVQGWTDTLSEMLANPMVSVALLQMGAALSAGRSAPEAMADTAGAVGRAGALADQYRRRQEGDEMLRRKAGLEEKRFGLEERELGAREKLWNAQTANYERMARGGGGGGGGRAGAGTPSESEVAAEVKKLTDAGWPEDVAREAVLKKLYKYGPSRYSTAAGNMTPDQYARKADRLKALEALDADVLSKPDPARTSEIGQLKSELFGTQNVGAQAPAAAQQKLPGGVASSPFDAGSPERADFKTAAEANEAFTKGALKVGTKVFVNGKHVATVMP